MAITVDKQGKLQSMPFVEPLAELVLSGEGAQAPVPPPEPPAELILSRRVL